MDDGWANGARYGGEHGKQRSLHEILLRRRAGVYRLGIETEERLKWRLAGGLAQDFWRAWLFSAARVPQLGIQPTKRKPRRAMKTSWTLKTEERRGGEEGRYRGAAYH